MSAESYSPGKFALAIGLVVALVGILTALVGPWAFMASPVGFPVGYLAGARWLS
jgi:hypothetical protein